jgi:hypothetical protein
VHREERHRLLLARREQRVELSGIRVVAAQLAAERHELIRHAGHRRDHHRDLVSGLCRLAHPLSDISNPLRVGDARAAEFLHHECHLRTRSG